MNALEESLLCAIEAGHVGAPDYPWRLWVRVLARLQALNPPEKTG